MLYLLMSILGARAARTLSGSDDGLGSVIASACPVQRFTDGEFLSNGSKGTE